MDAAAPVRVIAGLGSDVATAGGAASKLVDDLLKTGDDAVRSHETGHVFATSNGPESGLLTHFGDDMVRRFEGVTQTAGQARQLFQLPVAKQQNALLGAPGIGKTAALEDLARQHGGQVVRVDVDELMTSGDLLGTAVRYADQPSVLKLGDQLSARGVPLDFEPISAQVRQRLLEVMENGVPPTTPS